MYPFIKQNVGPSEKKPNIEYLRKKCDGWGNWQALYTEWRNALNAV